MFDERGIDPKETSLTTVMSQPTESNTVAVNPVVITPKSQSIVPINDFTGEVCITIDTTTNYSYVDAPAGPFSNKKVRSAFIRKVYSILTVQIIVTTFGAAIMFFLFKDELNLNTLRQNQDKSGEMLVWAIILISFVVVLTISVIFCCSMTARRTVPCNYILLGIFTVAETLIVGVTCAQTEGENIILAFVITGVVVFAITLLAMTPWFDITHCGFLLCILLIIHLVMGLVIGMVVMALGIDAKPLYLALSVFGAFLFSLYLLYDTQMIMGGKKYEVSPEEYIFAAICLYVDIIQIFLHILAIITNVRSD